MDYFAANDLAAFSPVAGNPTESTAAGSFDPLYVGKCIDLPSGAIVKSASFINEDTGAVTPLTDFWIHFDSFVGNGSNVSEIEFYNSAGIAVLRMFMPSSTTRRFDYWNGAAWVTTGPVSTFPGNVSNLHTYDLHITTGAAGGVEMYGDNSLALTVTGLNAAVTNVQSFRVYHNGGNASRHSQFLVSDVSTVGAKVASMTPSANGTNTSWAGDYTGVAKLGYDDTTLISSATLGGKESYVASDITVPVNYAISSLWLAIRAKLKAASPMNILPIVRSGGVDYAGAYNFQALNASGYAPSLAVLRTDPNTGAAWTAANLNAAEIGVQTAA